MLTDIHRIQADTKTGSILSKGGKKAIMAVSKANTVGGSIIWATLVVFLLSQPLMVNADEETTIEWREAFVTVDAELREIEGHKDHAVGLMQQRGFAFYEDEEVATVSTWLTFERSGAETNYRGYAVYAFPDGATKIGRFTGTGDPQGEQSGQFSLECGTGRYEGITGQGHFTGHGFPPHGDIYLDVSGTYSLR